MLLSVMKCHRIIAFVASVATLSCVIHADSPIRPFRSLKAPKGKLSDITYITLFDIKSTCVQRQFIGMSLYYQ